MKPNELQPGMQIISVLSADIVKESETIRETPELDTVPNDAGLPRILIGKVSSTNEVSTDDSNSDYLEVGIIVTGVIYIDTDRVVRMYKINRATTMRYPVDIADTDSVRLFEYNRDSLVWAKIKLGQDVKDILRSYLDNVNESVTHDALAGAAIVEE